MGRNEADGLAKGEDTGGGRGGEGGEDSDTDWVSLSESRRRKVDSQMLASFHRRKDALSSFEKGGSERSMKRTFDRRSKSKGISQEMRERIDRIYNPAKYASKAEKKEQLRSVEGYLKALDLDGDGLVSREEYAAAFHVIDIDGDGKLSKEEYFLGGALPFKKLDKDGDGVITFEEFQKGYDILDKDKDGLVSRAEFMVHFKPNIMHRLTHFAESRHQKIQRLLAKTTSATILRDEMEKMDRKGVDSQTWIRAQAKELQKQLRDKNIAKQRRNVIMLGEG
jgi:Ca2+-binding EF-hand superfamily protein